jgi:ketosteroid isomerase-like protein
MKNLLLLLVLLCAPMINDLQAQSESDEAEIKAFIKEFVSAYNKQDVEAIQKMHLDDAVRIDQDGQETKGAAQIANLYKESFIKNNSTLTVKYSGLSWSDYHHAFVAKGTYEVKGKTVVYDIEIQEKGAFENVMIKEDGEWKIDRTFLSTN